MSERSPYQILGEQGIRELADAFYDVMDELPEAATIRAMHAESLDDIKSKLAEYLIGWMGGPPIYQSRYGTVCLTDPHAPYRIGPDERDQWLLCMDEALKRVKAPQEVVEMLKQPMFRVADTVRNRDHSGPGRADTDPNIIATD